MGQKYQTKQFHTSHLQPLLFVTGSAGSIFRRKVPGHGDGAEASLLPAGPCIFSTFVRRTGRQKGCKTVGAGVDAELPNDHFQAGSAQIPAFLPLDNRRGLSPCPSPGGWGPGAKPPAAPTGCRLGRELHRDPRSSANATPFPPIQESILGSK